MGLTIGILLALAFLWSLWRWRRVERTLRMLHGAALNRKIYLEGVGGQPKMSRTFRALADAINALVSENTRHRKEESEYSNQIRATLGAIREAILIIDGGRKVVFSNDFARAIFGNGEELEGKRLENIVHGAGIFQFIIQANELPIVRRKEIAVRCNNQDFWFEVSSSTVKNVGWIGEDSLLLVMHDITRLKQLENLRKEFVANVSHELKTPLTIIKGYAETVRDDAEVIKKEALERFADKIVKSSDRLNVLVEDLLTLSRLESKSNPLDIRPQNFVELIHEAVEPYRSRIKDPRKQKIEFSFEGDLRSVKLDRFRIQQVMDNLLENAFRYAPNFSTIRIQCGWIENAQTVECKVSDDGPGIPAEDLPHIFERFYRVDKGRSRERGGTGLGLSITKHIIQLHGGMVRADSKLGGGTTFTFTLPQN